MAEAPEQPKAPKGRRTPEELAAHYQRLANQTRARAAKAAKNALVKQKLELGDAALGAGLSTPAQVAAAAKNQPSRGLSSADQVMLDLFEKLFGPDGGIKVAEKRHWAALTHLVPMSSEQRDILFSHWEAKNWPMA